MLLKEGVKVAGTKPELLIGLMVMNEIYKGQGSYMTVTALTDGKHMAGSKHYVGQAADLRTRDLTPIQISNIHAKGKAFLTKDYDLVLESDHFHLEYDPK